jgi:hypothetical protein
MAKPHTETPESDPAIRIRAIESLWLFEWRRLARRGSCGLRSGRGSEPSSSALLRTRAAYWSWGGGSLGPPRSGRMATRLKPIAVIPLASGPTLRVDKN